MISASEIAPQSNALPFEYRSGDASHTTGLREGLGVTLTEEIRLLLVRMPAFEKLNPIRFRLDPLVAS
jgi:hypothetical protein